MDPQRRQERVADGDDANERRRRAGGGSSSASSSLCVLVSVLRVENLKHSGMHALEVEVGSQRRLSGWMEGRSTGKPSQEQLEKLRQGVADRQIIQSESVEDTPYQ